MNPSSAQELKSTSPAFCRPAGIRKRGNIEPPIAESDRTTSVDIAPSCARVRQTDARRSPNADVAREVERAMIRKPPMCCASCKRKAIAPQMNITIRSESFHGSIG